MVTNHDIEQSLEQALPELLRRAGVPAVQWRCEVHLHRGNRKKRKDAEFAGNWDPRTDLIRIVCSPGESADRTAPVPPGKPDPDSPENRWSDLIRALDRAERRPGYEFVSLKWFRDTALLHEHFGWASDELARHDALQEAIDRRLILTSKVANPRSPRFPVTAIRLNRHMPEVNAALGSHADSIAAFRPVPIRGEALSATVLRERR